MNFNLSIWSCPNTKSYYFFILSLRKRFNILLNLPKEGWILVCFGVIIFVEEKKAIERKIAERVKDKKQEAFERIMNLTQVLIESNSFNRLIIIIIVDILLQEKTTTKTISQNQNNKKKIQITFKIDRKDRLEKRKETRRKNRANNWNYLLSRSNCDGGGSGGWIREREREMAKRDDWRPTILSRRERRIVTIACESI